jgi:hypothetical protein
MTPDWTITAAAGRSLVTHHAAPRFTACWTSGEADRAGIDGPCWSDAGSGDDDGLHLFGFQWTDHPPDDVSLERLMQTAATIIDAWIADRL